MPLALVLATTAAVQTISFPTEDGGRVCADLYGEGTRAVVLAHGGRFNKESWREQAQVLASDRFRILAIDFRGFGCSTGPGQADFDHAPFEKDVIAAVRYLKAHGAKSVSVVGGSFGGAAAGDASIQSSPGEIDRIVFLGAAPNLPADKLKSRSLFIVAREDHNDSGARLTSHPCAIRNGSSGEGTHHSGWFCARSVSLSDGPEYSGHARDRAIPVNAIDVPPG
jgi:pimeloyl-ACP methyl ester carboxylesterase